MTCLEPTQRLPCRRSTAMQPAMTPASWSLSRTLVLHNCLRPGAPPRPPRPQRAPTARGAATANGSGTATLTPASQQGRRRPCPRSSPDSGFPLILISIPVIRFVINIALCAA